MELYSPRDLELFNTHIDDVIQKINDIVLTNYAPTKKEVTEIQKIILQFAKQKKRKLYGGYGLHLAIIDRDKFGSFYKEDELYSKDLDLYSPDPLNDIIELSNLITEKGYKNVYAREALHSETYSLEVNKHTYCDFSYVPKNVYNKIPYIEVNGYIVTYPYFLEIDYLKMFIDPILSSYRWTKSFERLYLLQKYYPIKYSKKQLAFESIIPKNIYDNIDKFIKNNKTIAVTGTYVYNMYVKMSKIKKSYINEIKIPYFELISMDYENDVKKIIDVIGKSDINIVEYYPFFTFTNFHTDILYKNALVARVYNNLHNLCFSCVSHDNVNIGSFHFNLRMCLVNAIYERVNENRNSENMFYDMASHMIQMRKEYFDSNDKNIFSETIFKDFGHKCIGFTQNDKIDHDEMYKKKPRVVFKYTPNVTKIDISKWRFTNSSGNQIHNPKNYKIKFDDHDYHVSDQKQKDQNDIEEYDDMDTSKIIEYGSDDITSQ